MGNAVISRKNGGGQSSLSSFTANWQGFTLAEVLITIGIIGVVVAMTLPALTSHYRIKEIPVRLEKFYSTMQNALNLAVLDYGEMQYWTYPAAQNDAESTSAFVDKYLFPYLTGIRKCEAGEQGCKQFANIIGSGSDRMPIYIFSDGSCFGMVAGDSNSSGAQLHITYDYNCLGKPNKWDEDRFTFYINSKSGTAKKYRNKIIAGNFPVMNAHTREDYVELCKNHDLDNHKGICSALIQYDGWAIKDDYPWLK